MRWHRRHYLIVGIHPWQLRGKKMSLFLSERESVLRDQTRSRPCFQLLMEQTMIIQNSWLAKQTLEMILVIFGMCNFQSWHLSLCILRSGRVYLLEYQVGVKIVSMDGLTEWLSMFSGVFVLLFFVLLAASGPLYSKKTLPQNVNPSHTRTFWTRCWSRWW